MSNSKYAKVILEGIQDLESKLRAKGVSESELGVTRTTFLGGALCGIAATGSASKEAYEDVKEMMKDESEKALLRLAYEEEKERWRKREN